MYIRSAELRLTLLTLRYVSALCRAEGVLEPDWTLLVLGSVCVQLFGTWPRGFGSAYRTTLATLTEKRLSVSPDGAAAAGAAGGAGVRPRTRLAAEEERKRGAAAVQAKVASFVERRMSELVLGDEGSSGSSSGRKKSGPSLQVSWLRYVTVWYGKVSARFRLQASGLACSMSSFFPCFPCVSHRSRLTSWWSSSRCVW
jgi:hypothetical protein